MCFWRVGIWYHLARCQRKHVQMLLGDEIIPTVVSLLPWNPHQVSSPHTPFLSGQRAHTQAHAVRVGSDVSNP